MEKEFVNKWYKNKDKLRGVISEKHWDNYIDLVRLIIKYILGEKYNSEEITEVDDGHYQGTKLFLFHEETYQPSIGQYVLTNNHYGSCTGCDTLKRIKNFDEGKPSEEQVEDYMTLCLHLVQKMKKLNEENEIC
jgi:hypothetical protein